VGQSVFNPEDDIQMNELKELTNAEWKIMRIVWEERKAMTREIYTIAAERYDWSPATVKTLLRRIVDKGYIHVTQIGNGFLYRPARSSLQVVKKAVESLLDNAVEGTGPLLVQLVENAALNDNDLNSLQEMIEQKRKSITKKQRR
jgi:predicted transcriptional regulator